MYGHRFTSRGFTDRREILHGGSATSQTGLLLFEGDGPRDGRVMGVNRAIWRDMLLAEASVFIYVRGELEVAADFSSL